MNIKIFRCARSSHPRANRTKPDFATKYDHKYGTLRTHELASRSKLWCLRTYDETARTRRSEILPELCCKTHFATIHTYVRTIERFWFSPCGAHLSMCSQRVFYKVIYFRLTRLQKTFDLRDYKNYLESLVASTLMCALNEWPVHLNHRLPCECSDERVLCTNVI